MDLLPNTVKVAPENICDICKKRKASYYNLMYYIHICSTECYEKFIEGYNREINEIAIKLWKPDGVEDKDETQ